MVAAVAGPAPDPATAALGRGGRGAAPLRGRYEPACRAIDALDGRDGAASSLVENLNSRLRTYFSLRRHLGPDYLDLLRFYLNHRVLEWSERPERRGKTPAELLTGREHAHWLELLGFSASPAP